MFIIFNASKKDNSRQKTNLIFPPVFTISRHDVEFSFKDQLFIKQK